MTEEEQAIFGRALRPPQGQLRRRQARARRPVARHRQHRRLDLRGRRRGRGPGLHGGRSGDHVADSAPASCARSGSRCCGGATDAERLVDLRRHRPAVRRRRRRHRRPRPAGRALPHLQQPREDHLERRARACSSATTASSTSCAPAAATAAPTSTARPPRPHQLPPRGVRLRRASRSPTASSRSCTASGSSPPPRPCTAGRSSSRRSPTPT